ncbi:Ni/Co efflux regulator RcnB [Massilia sp. MP_M2]|uniref:RcnB family protein n=1 Tax=Massilia sp. MP_M2 TaxID=3071713 RepID=UPI00319DD03B
MNELIAPLLFAAIFSAGDNLQTRHARDSHATAPPEVAVVLPSLYRSVESSGELRRGERLPARYQSLQYVVEDWRKLRLGKPPRGHQWVQADRSFALVAIATGRVEQVVLVR